MNGNRQGRVIYGNKIMFTYDYQALCLAPRNNSEKGAKIFSTFITTKNFGVFPENFQENILLQIALKVDALQKIFQNFILV